MDARLLVGTINFLAVFLPVLIALQGWSIWWLLATAAIAALCASIRVAVLQRGWLERPGQLVSATIISTIPFGMLALAFYWVTRGIVSFF